MNGRPGLSPDLLREGALFRDGYLIEILVTTVVLAALAALLVVEQNRESAVGANDLRGRRVRLAWRPDQAFDISTPHAERSEQ